MAAVELTNMCMIYDEATDQVLMQDRIKSWKGLAFPGGHVEEGESIVDSTIREVREETGLEVSNLQLCGIMHWYNDETGDKYLVFSFKTSTFSGELLAETDEGRLIWVNRDELPDLPLAEGFKERLPLFLEGTYSEGFGIWNDHHVGRIEWK